MSNTSNYYERAHTLATRLASTGYQSFAADVLSLTADMINTIKSLEAENKTLKKPRTLPDIKTQFEIINKMN